MAASFNCRKCRRCLTGSGAPDTHILELPCSREQRISKVQLHLCSTGMMRKPSKTFNFYMCMGVVLEESFYGTKFLKHCPCAYGG